MEIADTQREDRLTLGDLYCSDTHTTSGGSDENPVTCNIRVGQGCEKN